MNLELQARGRPYTIEDKMRTFYRKCIRSCAKGSSFVTLIRFYEPQNPTASFYSLVNVSLPDKNLSARSPFQVWGSDVGSLQKTELSEVR